MRIPIAIYPFCAEILPVVKTFDKLQELYTINRLISPSGFGMTGYDAGYICNHPDTGIVVTDEFDFDSMEWTTLILFEPIMLKEKISYSYETIAEQALQSGKYVIFLGSSVKVKNQLNKLSDTYPDRIEIRTYLDSFSKSTFEKAQVFHEAEIPIILVGGLIEEADTFEVLLKLAAKAKEENVKALVFSKHPIAELLDFHNINHIWECTTYTEVQKIESINNYINNKVESLRPEVIFLEAPDAIMRFTDFAPNGFGVRTFMICQAVTPDQFVCCLPFEFAVNKFISKISDGFERTLGSPITAVHVSNVFMDAQEIILTHDISIVRNNLKFVHDQLLKESEYSQIPMHDVVTDGIDAIYNDLFEN
jgi:hypothetical protein